MAPGGLIEMSCKRVSARACCTWPPTKTQAATRGIKLQVWLVWQIEVPMGTTNWYKKQGSIVFSFLWEAVSHTVTQLMQVG